MARAPTTTIAMLPLSWWNLSGRSRLMLLGDDRVRFLNNLCSNDIVRLPVGAGCEAFLCNAKGGVLFFVTVFKENDSLWLESDASYVEALMKHLDRYIIREKVELKDRSSNTELFHVAGSDAPTFLKDLLGVDVPMEILSCQEMDWHGERIQIHRVDRGTHGWDVIVPHELGMPFRQAAEMTFRQPEGTAIDLERFRVAAGIPILGLDVPEGCLPQEFDRTEKAISFTKGCYIGQETVARLDAYGHVNRILCGLTIDAETPPVTGAVIQHAGKEIGVLGSVVRSLNDQHWNALALLRTTASQAGTVVQVRGANDESIPALVVKFPME